MKDKVIRNDRQQSNAGWFVGGMVFCEDNAECYDKDEFSVRPSEEMVKNDYPRSISVKEAFQKAKRYGWLK